MEATISPLPFFLFRTLDSVKENLGNSYTNGYAVKE